jgi:hypothetical protein
MLDLPVVRKDDAPLTYYEIVYPDMPARELLDLLIREALERGLSLTDVYVHKDVVRYLFNLEENSNYAPYIAAGAPGGYWRVDGTWYRLYATNWEKDILVVSYSDPYTRQTERYVLWGNAVELNPVTEP